MSICFLLDLEQMQMNPPPPIHCHQKPVNGSEQTTFYGKLNVYIILIKFKEKCRKTWSCYLLQFAIRDMVRASCFTGFFHMTGANWNPMRLDLF